MTSGSNRARDFFISRTDSDKAIAVAIARIIREAGHTTWLQDENFGHASFMARMEQGQDSGTRLIALLSQAYQASRHCRAEYNAVLAGDPENVDERLIVLRVAECEGAGSLRAIAYTDLVPVLAITDDEQRREEIRRVIRVVIGAETRQSEIDIARLYRHAPQQILHPEIAAVTGFTGRENLLAALGRALSAKGSVAALTNSRSATAALRGLGGVGKSALAREYAWRQRGSYGGVWWVKAETRETLLDDLVALGARLGIPDIEAAPDRAAAARLALDRLEARCRDAPWLVVYDNVESPKDIEGLTPRSNAHVLITTRWSDWYGHAAELPVDVFSADVAIDFLMAQARGSAERPAETLAQAARLADEVGRLPLALAIARAHSWGMNWSFEKYRQHLAEMIARQPTRAVDYPRSIAATFELAMDRAKATSPEAELLLGIAAFLAPDLIPLDMVTSDVMSELELGEAVAALAEVSLVSREALDDGAPAISVHRLVQEVVRGRLGGRAAEIAAVATRLVADSYPFEASDVRNWPACHRLGAHAEAVLAHAPDTGPAARKTSLLLNQYSLHLEARAKYAAAERYLRRALKLDEESLGAHQLVVATRLNNLAGVLRKLDCLTEAEAYYLRALAITEQSFASDHPKVAAALNNLAVLYVDQNRFLEAESLHLRALSIREGEHTVSRSELAETLYNLAVLYCRQGRNKQSETYCSRALAVWENSLGPNHPDICDGLGILAHIYQDQGRIKDAAELLHRILRITETAYGPDHPNLGICLLNLAQHNEQQGLFAEAEPFYRRALSIAETKLGATHSLTCNLRSGLEAIRIILNETGTPSYKTP